MIIKTENIKEYWEQVEKDIDSTNNVEKDSILCTGRTLNDISLDELSCLYKRRILDIITKLQNGIVVFDFDGTLTEFKYADKTLLPCKEEDLHEYSKFGNIYENIYILKTMQYIINQLNPDKIYVITNSATAIKDKKNSVISSGFPTVKKENVYHTRNVKEKLDVLAMLYNKTEHKILFVEDMVSTLQMAEEKYNFVEGVHISSLLP